MIIYKEKDSNVIMLCNKYTRLDSMFECISMFDHHVKGSSRVNNIINID